MNAEVEEYLKFAFGYERPIKIIQSYNKKDNIDHLLDQYNDYIRLYEMFGDNMYQDVAKLLLKEMRRWHESRGDYTN